MDSASKYDQSDQSAEQTLRDIDAALAERSLEGIGDAAKYEIARQPTAELPDAAHEDAALDPNDDATIEHEKRSQSDDKEDYWQPYNDAGDNDVTQPRLGTDAAEIRTSPLPGPIGSDDDTDPSLSNDVTYPGLNTDVSQARTSPLPGRQSSYDQLGDTQPAPDPRPVHPSERELTDPGPDAEWSDISTRELPNGEGDFYGAPTEENTLPAGPPPPIDQQDTLHDLPKTEPGPDRG